MPPIEKIPEAYTAIEDLRIEVFEDSAKVKSSNGEKEYLIKWKENVYYSNDNSTYWQGYTGYPVIAVLMVQGKLSLNRDISKYFKSVNWSELNKKNKRDYKKSVDDILFGTPENEKEKIFREIEKVFEDVQRM